MHNDGSGLYGATIQENGSDNKTISDIDGNFQLITTQDTCTVSFSWIGYETKTITVTKDTTVTIALEIWNYTSKWITLGSSYDVFNTTFGYVVSNGFDEHPLIHFEDFSESWIYKASGSTNFMKDYSFGFKLARDYVFRRIYMPTFEFKRTKYSSNSFEHTDLNLSFGIGIRRFSGTILLKSGYQKLNGENNFGAGMGLQKSHRRPNLYYGFIVGFWNRYFTYTVFFQSFLYRHKLSIRTAYDRIENFNFLNFGIHYTFNR